jgi:putative addiction module component (TIGR02574 family)
MNIPVERLEAEVLQLPPDERARLARRLIASLDEGSPEDPAEVEREWKAEIERRLEAYRRGDVKAVPASQVIADARARLR